MNSAFQDINFNDNNKKLYQDTAECDLTRNVNPVAQRQIFRELKKRQKYIITTSLSPDPAANAAATTTSASSTTAILIPNSNSLTALIKKQRKGTLSSTSSTLFPLLNSSTNNQSIDFKRKPFFYDGSSSPKQNQQMNSTATQLIDRNASDSAVFTLTEDQREREYTTRTEFIKNKYESLIKNSFRLRNKMSNKHSQSQSLLNNQSQNQNSQTSRNEFTTSHNPNCPFGIFLKKTKPNRFAEDEIDLNNSLKPSTKNQQKLRYEKILKLLNLDNPTYIENTSTFFNSRTTPKDAAAQSSYRYDLSNQQRMTSTTKESNSNMEIDDDQDITLKPSNPLNLRIKTQEGTSSTSRSFDRIRLPKVANVTKDTTNPPPPTIKIIQIDDKKTILSTFDLQQQQTQQLNLKTKKPSQLPNTISIQSSANQLHKPLKSNLLQQLPSNPTSAIPSQRSEKPESRTAERTQVKTSSSSHIKTQKQMQINIESEDEISSPLQTLHNAISILNEDQPDQIQETDHSENSDTSLQHDGRSTLHFHKTIHQSKYQQYQEGNTSQDGLDNPDQNQSLKSQYRHSRNLPSISVKIPNNDQFSDSLNENENDNNQEEEEESDSDSHGFVLKKQIDFNQLRELRDKTINKSTVNSPLPKRQPQLKILVNSKLSRQNSSTQSPQKIKLIPVSSSPLINATNSPQIKPSSYQPTGEKDSKTSQHESQTTDGAPSVPDSKKTKSNPKKKSLKTITTVASSLRKFFRKSKKKKQKKPNVEEKNQEEVQREQDIEIATQLEEAKDKLRAGVKVIIRDQIQKRIQSTLAQSFLSKAFPNLNTSNLNDSSSNTNLVPSSPALPPSEISTPLLKNSSGSPFNSENNLVPPSTTTTSKFTKFSQQQQPQSTKTPSIPAQPQLTGKNTSTPQFTPSTPLLASQKNPSQSLQKFFASPQLQQYGSSTQKNTNMNQQSTQPQQQQQQQQQQQHQSSQQLHQQAVSPNTSTMNASNAINNRSTNPGGNPSYESQMREVAEYSSAIMNFFDACIDNLKENENAFNHDFQLRNLKNFDSQMSENLVKTFETELRKQKMSSENVERFKYIYEINTKMHVFYQGMILTLGGIDRVKDLVEIIVKKVSSHITLFPINHVYSFDAMHRRIIPAICAILCDDHRLFLQTLRYFQQSNETEAVEFSFIDFFFIKKELFSLLIKKKQNEISTTLALSIIQKIESVRRYIFPLDVLSGVEIRAEITHSLSTQQSFMEIFNPKTFNQEQVGELIDIIFDYFYSDKEDISFLDFNRIKSFLDRYLLKKLPRKVFDYIEVATQQALQQDRFTRNVILRDLHYKFSKIRLRFGFKQGVFGVFKFDQYDQLLDLIKDEVENLIRLGNFGLTNYQEEEIEKLSDLHFLKYYLRFLLSEYDIFSVYDFSVAMPYFGVTLKIFRFWMTSLRNVLLTKYRVLPSKADIFVRFFEACCPTT